MYLCFGRPVTIDPDRMHPSELYGPPNFFSYSAIWRMWYAGGRKCALATCWARGLESGR